MLITNGTIRQRGARRRTIQRQVTFGPMTLRVVTVVILGFLCFGALANSTASATKNYEVTELTQKSEELQEEVERLKVQAARHNALNAVMAEQVNPTPSPTPQLEEPKQINHLPSDEVASVR